MIPMLSVPVVIGSATDPSWSVVYNQNVTISGTTTVIPLTIGAEAPERRLIVLIGGWAAPSSFDWEGDSFFVNFRNAWGMIAAQGDRVVPTGTSGDLTIDWGGDLTSLVFSITVIVANNVGTFVQWNSDASAASSGTISTSVSTGSTGQKGLIFATLTSEFQLDTTWQLPSGIVEQLDRNFASSRHSWAVYESNGGSETVRAFQNNTWNDKALLAIAFRKT